MSVRLQRRPPWDRAKKWRFAGLVTHFAPTVDIEGRPTTSKHRYRDSNPGFRTENPIREASFRRFGRVWAHLGQWSAVEFTGVGDQFRDQVLLGILPSAVERRRAKTSRSGFALSTRKGPVGMRCGSCSSSIAKVSDLNLRPLMTPACVAKPQSEQIPAPPWGRTSGLMLAAPEEEVCP